MMELYAGLGRKIGYDTDLDRNYRWKFYIQKQTYSKWKWNYYK